MEVYTDAKGVDRCDNCGEIVDVCECRCIVCGDDVTECACEEGPTYPAVYVRADED